MSQIFGTGGASGSTIGKQFNDKSWSRVAIMEAKKKKTFSQMGDKLTQPKHYGDKIVKYHEIPILHASNINDQGIDANGVSLTSGKWYAYDSAGVSTNSDVGYATKYEAVAAAGATGSILAGDGNLYGGSSDILVQRGAFPPLTEEGGAYNQVGMKRLDIEATVSEFGFAMTFTKRSLEMDTETGLLARYSRGVGEAYGDLREAQIQSSLLSASETNRTYGGTATSLATITIADGLTFGDLRLMDQSLKDARCPKDTKLIDGSTKIGTSTVAKARYAYVGSEMLPTLEDMTTTIGSTEKLLWVPVEMYAAAGKVAEDEIGKISQFRFIEVEEMAKYEGVGSDIDEVVDDAAGEATATIAGSDNFYATTTATDTLNLDVFPVLFVGSGSFATVGFEGDSARVTTVMPKADAHNDFYGKKGAVSISWYYGFMALRPEWIRQIAVPAKIA